MVKNKTENNDIEKPYYTIFLGKGQAFYLYLYLCACLVAQSCPALRDPMDCSLSGSSVHGDSPDKNIGVGCHALLYLYLIYISSLVRKTKIDLAYLNKGKGGKESACNTGDLGSIPGSERSPGEGTGNLLQCSCLENPWTEEPGGLQFIASRRVRHN